MAAKVGPLLSHAMSAIGSVPTSFAVGLAAGFGSKTGGEELPVVVKLPTMPPPPGTSWQTYRDHVLQRLSPLQEMLDHLLGAQANPLITANALQADLTAAQINQLRTVPNIELLELDPVVKVVKLDDCVTDLETQTFIGNHSGVRGNGVRVAVLDSGIDLQHPYLRVFDSVSVITESDQIPGRHGTHCAGCIASRDSIYPGIAPEVDLINVKVLRSDGTGRHTDITKGIDEALDRDAKVLSMSLGFNHLPTWSDGGHGWSCADGTCPLCTAVDNAVSLDNVVVVVAAGNEHQRAEALRTWGYGDSLDTELSCPGQARLALTIGAFTKQTFLPAPFSSRGPSSFGLEKPDVCAPGVNITSTVPVPRDTSGQPVVGAPRSEIFQKDSGTSMATPMVAAAAALAIQLRTQNNVAWKPADIVADILSGGVVSLGLPRNVVGAGRLCLRGL